MKRSQNSGPRGGGVAKSLRKIQGDFFLSLVPPLKYKIKLEARQENQSQTEVQFRMSHELSIYYHAYFIGVD